MRFRAWFMRLATRLRAAWTIKQCFQRKHQTRITATRWPSRWLSGFKAKRLKRRQSLQRWRHQLAAKSFAPQFGPLEQRIVMAADTAFDRQAPVAAPLQPAADILFVDSALPDSSRLFAALSASTAAGHTNEVIALDPDRDAISQITAALAGRSDLASIQIVSHGFAGGLVLGNETIDAAALESRAGKIMAWSGSLSADADILLYGCDVAAGPAGAAFIDILAGLTGADVAASVDVTGNAAVGGNWVLEAATGPIAAVVPAAAFDGYGSALQVNVRADTANGKKVSTAVATPEIFKFDAGWWPTTDHHRVEGKGGAATLDFSATTLPLTVQLAGVGSNSPSIKVFPTAVGAGNKLITAVAGAFTLKSNRSKDLLLDLSNQTQKLIIEVGPGGKTTVRLNDAPAGQGPLVVVDGVTNILGGSGDDTIRFLKGATLKGWVDGGGGNNMLDYSSIPSTLTRLSTGYSVNLSKAKVGTIPTPAPANQLYFTDTLPLGGVARISVVTGSGKIDTLTGGIAGGIATVTLQGGLGDDKLRGNNESATLEGGLGSDTYIFLNEDFERYTANGTARQTITEKSNPADAEFAKWKANIDVLDLSKLTSKLPADSTNPAYLISATIDGLQVSQQRTGASNTSINLFSSSVKGLEKILSPSSTALTTYSFSNGWGNLAIEGLEPAMANLDFSRVTTDLLFEIGKNPIGSAPVSLTVSEAVSDGKGGWKAKVGGDRLTVTSSPGIPRQNLCRDLTGGLGNNHYKFIDHYSIAGDLKQAAGQLQGRQNTLDYSDYQSVAIDPRLRNAGVTTSLSSVTTPPPLVRPPVSQAFTAPGIPTAFKMISAEAYKRDPADNASTVYDGKVTLDWKAPTGSVAVSEYLVEFSKDNGKNWQRYATPTADKLATTLIIQPLEVDSSYTFQVSAVAAGGIVGLPTESALARVPSPADATKPNPVAATPTVQPTTTPAQTAISVALGANLFTDPVKGNNPLAPTVVSPAVVPAQERWTFTSSMLKGSINFGGSLGGPEKTLTYDVSRYDTMQTSYEQQFKELAAGVLGRSDFSVDLGLIKTGTAADSAVQSLTWSVKFSAPGGVDPQKFTDLHNVIKDGQRPWAPTDTWAASNDLFEKIRTNKQGPAEGEYLTQLRELLARTNSGTTATGIKLARGTSPAGQKLITFTVSYRPGPGTSEKTPPYSALFRYFEDSDPDYPVFGVFDLGEDKAFVRWGSEPAPVPGDSGTFSQTLELGVPVGGSGQIIQPKDRVGTQVVLSLRDAAAVAPAAAPDFASQAHPGRVAVDTIADISTTAKDGNFALAFEFDAQDGRRIGLTTADIPRNAAPGVVEKAIQTAVDEAVGPQVIPETGIGGLTSKRGVSLLNKGVIDAEPVVTVSRGDGSTEFPWRIAFANMGQVSWHAATAQQDDISLPVNAGVPAIIQAGKTTSVTGTVEGVTRVIGSSKADTIRGVASESKQLFSFTSLTAGGYRLNTKSLTVADAGAVDVVNGLRRRQAVLYSVESTTAGVPYPEGSEIGGLKSGRIYFINTSVAPNPVAQSPATVPVVSFYETPDFSISKLSALSDSGIRLTLPTAGVDAVRHVFREVFTIDGGSGDDRITAAYDPLNNPLGAGQTRANYLVGSGGHDRIIGGLDADYIDGGAGDDFLVADATTPAVSSSNPTVPNWIDTLRGGAGADTVLGTSTGDILLGDAGNDTIIPGESGKQFLQGGDGNDSLVIGSRGSATDYHTLAGGDGNDTYKLTGSWGVASIRETARNGSADTIDLSSSSRNYVHILSNGSLYSTAGRLHNGTVTMDAAATAAGVAAIPLGTNTDLLTGTAVSYGQVLTQWGFGLHQAANGVASEVAINEAGSATIGRTAQPAVITAFAGSESTRANGQKFDTLDFQLRVDRGAGTTVYDATLSDPTLNDGVYRIPEARQAEMLRAVLAAARVTHAAVPAWSLTETLDQNKARLTPWITDQNTLLKSKTGLEISLDPSTLSLPTFDPASHEGTAFPNRAAVLQIKLWPLLQQDKLGTTFSVVAPALEFTVRGSNAVATGGTDKGGLFGSSSFNFRNIEKLDLGAGAQTFVLGNDYWGTDGLEERLNKAGQAIPLLDTIARQFTPELTVDTSQSYAEETPLTLDFRAVTNELRFTFSPNTKIDVATNRRVFDPDSVTLTVTTVTDLTVPVIGLGPILQGKPIVFTHIGKNTVLYGARGENTFHFDRNAVYQGDLIAGDLELGFQIPGNYATLHGSSTNNFSYSDFAFPYVNSNYLKNIGENYTAKEQLAQASMGNLLPATVDKILPRQTTGLAGRVVIKPFNLGKTVVRSGADVVRGSDFFLDTSPFDPETSKPGTSKLAQAKQRFIESQFSGRDTISVGGSPFSIAPGLHLLMGGSGADTYQFNTQLWGAALIVDDAFSLSIGTGSGAVDATINRLMPKDTLDFSNVFQDLYVTVFSVGLDDIAALNKYSQSRQIPNFGVDVSASVTLVTGFDPFDKS